MTLSAARAQELFRYDPETGELYHRRAKGRAAAGSEAGSVYGHGYRIVSADGVRYSAGPLIWLMMTGAWPKGEIDHFNRLRDDNRWSNLRDLAHVKNMHNTGPSRVNSSGATGVTWHKNKQKWIAHIRVNGTQMHLGYFDLFEEAVAVRRAAKEKQHA